MKVEFPCLTLLVFISVSLCGCVSDVANRYYLTETFAPKTTEQVELLTSKPIRPYIVIADFQSRGDSAEGLREKAAKIGADAIIVSNFGGSYALSEQWAGADRYADTGSRVSGTAIRYK